MFEFQNITLSDDGNRLSAKCRISADNPCFRGHFPTFSLLPGVSQVLMLAMLIEQQTTWSCIVVGGSGIKYLHPVLPGEELLLQLQRDGADKVVFSISSEAVEKTKGRLQVAGERP